jgi:hypothetical protein
MIEPLKPTETDTAIIYPTLEVIAKINELIAAYNEHAHQVDLEPSMLGETVATSEPIPADPVADALPSKPVEATELGGDDHE